MLMQIDGTFIFVVISFLIFLFIIKTILFNPINKVIDERTNFYTKNSKMETESKEKSQTLLEQKNQALKTSRQEATNIVKSALEEAKEKNSKKIKQAKKEVQTLIEKNKNKLEEVKKQTKQEVKSELNYIVKSMVSKVLGKETNVNLDDEKINKYLNI